MLGAVLLVLSEFTHLYSIHIASQHAPVSSVTGGSHNSYAFVPIGVLAALLAFGAARERSRAALLALVAIGVISLLIALIGDLPDAQAGGLLLRGGHLVIAKATPDVGMYLESLGSIALVLAGGLGLLLGPPPPRRERRRAGQICHLPDTLLRFRCDRARGVVTFSEREGCPAAAPGPVRRATLVFDSLGWPWARSYRWFETRGAV